LWGRRPSRQFLRQLPLLLLLCTLIKAEPRLSFAYFKKFGFFLPKQVIEEARHLKH
jgi:hypothetical protein